MDDLSAASTLCHAWGKTRPIPMPNATVRTISEWTPGASSQVPELTGSRNFD
jgi:hypothetical protein